MRPLALLALLMFCAVGVVGTASAQAKAKTPNQRVRALERRLTDRARTLVALQKDTQRLVRAHNTLIANMDGLYTRYFNLQGCLGRTPLNSWPGYVFDTNGGTVTGNTTTTALDWYTPGGSFPTDVLTDPFGKIHALGLSNTDACLAPVAFYNPIPVAAAGLGAANLGAKSQELKP
jgi:hypothetical protein